MANELVRTLLDRLAEEPVNRVREVRLRKGELLILSETALQSAYEILTERTVLEGSELIVEEVKVGIECTLCGYSGGIEYHKDLEYHFIVPILTCPKCEGAVEVTEGKDLQLVSLVVEDVTEPEKDRDNIG